MCSRAELSFTKLAGAAYSLLQNRDSKVEQQKETIEGAIQAL